MPSTPSRLTAAHSRTDRSPSIQLIRGTSKNSGSSALPADVDRCQSLDRSYHSYDKASSDRLAASSSLDNIYSGSSHEDRCVSFNYYIMLVIKTLKCQDTIQIHHYPTLTSSAVSKKSPVMATMLLQPTEAICKNVLLMSNCSVSGLVGIHGVPLYKLNEESDDHMN